MNVLDIVMRWIDRNEKLGLDAPLQPVGIHKHARGWKGWRRKELARRRALNSVQAESRRANWS